MSSLVVDSFAPGVMFGTSATVTDSAGESRARGVIVGLDEKSWPDSYQYLGNHPSGQEETSWSEHLQGMAHDDRYWYITGMHTDDDPVIMKVDATQGITSLYLIRLIRVLRG